MMDISDCPSYIYDISMNIIYSDKIDKPLPDFRFRSGVVFIPVSLQRNFGLYTARMFPFH